jgi:phenylalanyl-tRNA synthetase, alpha subunit
VELSPKAYDLLMLLRDQNEVYIDEAEEELGLPHPSVNRAALELEEGGLVETEEEAQVTEELTDKGEEVVKSGSPEFRLVELVRGGDSGVGEIQTELESGDVAIGKARQRGWIDIQDGEVSLTEKGRGAEDEVRAELEDQSFRDEHHSRGLVSSETETNRRISVTETGKNVDVERDEGFNATAPATTPVTGKKHFYRQIIDEARRRWLEMGFQEMNGDYAVSSLLNFDALFTPQDHPARELHDTFYLENPRESDTTRFGDAAENIRKVHEDGGDTGSRGWRYDWDQKEAARNVLRTHTTAVSAEKLLELDEEDLPAKFFGISRAFRNETVDATHLPEFYQSDGIVVGKELSFRDLKGYLEEYFSRMGFGEIRVVPTYYPYTEMSAEVQFYNDRDGEWYQLGGSGMFRPEVVEPLLGFEATVLAWGLGIGRIAMNAAELSDIRELYRNDIETIEGTEVWLPE